MSARLAEYMDLFWPSFAGGAAIAGAAGLLSPYVVLRRFAFIGQGVSHAAFGGVGLAAVLGLTGATLGSGLGYLGVVGGFCVATALGIGAATSGRSDGDGSGGLRSDTVIGMFLVASMALGAMLLSWSQRRSAGGRPVSVEDWLFGSISVVHPVDAGLAAAAGLGVAAALWTQRRPMMFWAFDEGAARAFGAPAARARLVLLAALGVTIVVSMKLAGAVLATALLVLPGAAALQLSRRVGPVFALSVVLSVAGVIGGLTASLWLSAPSGPCVVAGLLGLFIVAAAVRMTASRRRGPASESAS